MLVAADHAVLASFTARIVDDGYGYSSNVGTDPDLYDRNEIMEMLKDWGWTGPEDRKPDWLD